MPHVQSRLILNFSGFEPSSNQRLLGRILYSIDKAKQLWGIETKVLETTSHQNKPHSVCQLDAAGENWKISARIVQLGFGEIVGKYQVDSNPYLLVKNFLKYLTLLFDGTFIKYVRLTILFWVFFLYPLAVSIFFGGVSYFATDYLFRTLFELPVNPAPKFLTGVLFFFLLCRWPGKYLRYTLALALWGFSYDIARGNNYDITKCVSEFSEILSYEVGAQEYDEITIVGHSFGASWAALSLSAALQNSKNLVDKKKVTFLLLGSHLLSVALIDRAGVIKRIIAQLAQKNELFWHEMYFKFDVISLYPADLFHNLDLPTANGGYKITKVNFKASMKTQRFWNMMRSFYYTHRQYVLYHDNRVNTDLMLHILGPISAKELALYSEDKCLEKLAFDYHFNRESSAR